MLLWSNYGTNSFQPNIINILRSMAEGWYLADVCKFPGSATIWQKQMMANLEMGGHFSTDYGTMVKKILLKAHMSTHFNSGFFFNKKNWAPRKQEAKELKESAGERLRYARIAKFAKVCSAKVCLAKVCTVLFVCERLRGTTTNFRICGRNLEVRC